MKKSLETEQEREAEQRRLLRLAIRNFEKDKLKPKKEIIQEGIISWLPLEKVKDFVELLKANVSSETFKLYDVVFCANGGIKIECKAPFEKVKVAYKPKEQDKVLISIPASKSTAYDIKDADNYFCLIKGGYELNQFFKKFV